MAAADFGSHHFYFRILLLSLPNEGNSHQGSPSI